MCTEYDMPRIVLFVELFSAILVMMELFVE